MLFFVNFFTEVRTELRALSPQRVLSTQLYPNPESVVLGIFFLKNFFWEHIFQSQCFFSHYFIGASTTRACTIITSRLFLTKYASKFEEYFLSIMAHLVVYFTILWNRINFDLIVFVTAPVLEASQWNLIHCFMKS